MSSDILSGVSELHRWARQAQTMGLTDLGITDLIRFALDVVEARLPFRLNPHISGLPHTLAVTLTNHTKDMPLFVHAVRLHVGTSEDSWAFVLEPISTVEIQPRNRHTFLLSFTNTRIEHSKIEERDPPWPEEPPPFKSAADLFKKFASEDARSSWIEIDFNEFTRRRFRRGKIRWMFSDFIKQGPPTKI